MTLDLVTRFLVRSAATLLLASSVAVAAGGAASPEAPPVAPPASPLASPPGMSPIQAAMQPAPGGVDPAAPSLQGESRYTLEDKAMQHFITGFNFDNGFASLDADAKAFRDSKAQFETGEYKLAVLYRGMSMPEVFPNMLARLDAWAAAAPQSPTPSIVRAQMRLESLTRRLGSAFHTRQGTQSAELDVAALRSLRDELSSKEQLLAVDPHWHYLMARIAMLLREPEPVVTAAVMRGLRVAPGYGPLLGVGTDYFMPKWSGSAADLERWALSVDEEPSQKGTGAYARIQMHAFEVQFGNELFAKSGIDWARFKASARDWSPATESAEVLSEVTLMACLSGDRREARRLFAISKEPVFMQHWGRKANRDRCKAWAERPVWQAWLASLIAGFDDVIDMIAGRLGDLLARA